MVEEREDDWRRDLEQANKDVSRDHPIHIGIVGLGLIGGSLARRLANAGCKVSAWNHRDHPYQDAQQAGITCTDTLEELVASNPEILILCNPLVAMPSVLQTIKPVLDPEKTTLCDVGSVKGLVRQQVHEAGLVDCYVGAHPMTGNEYSGWDSADPALFDNALWALTYGPHTEYRRVVQVAGMVTRSLFNRLIIIDDETHDRAAGMISHMPHVVSTALINMLVCDEYRNVDAALAAGSFRDMTRVSLTDPSRTRAMVEENRDNVVDLLKDMSHRLNDIADALAANDDAAISEFFAQGNPFRTYKTTQRKQFTGEDTQTMFSSLSLDDDWRATFLKSARRGEQIVRFTAPNHALAECRYAI